MASGSCCPARQTRPLAFAAFGPSTSPPSWSCCTVSFRAHWNRGLATEAARALLRFGFEERGFPTIRASTDALNTASIRVLEKIGMRFHKRELSNGLDTVYYTIARNAFREGER